MPCFRPVKGFYSKSVNANGKRSLVFSSDNALIDVAVFVPCGRCIGCRLDRSRDWAVRCMHEASLHDENCFITLTFNDEHLGDGSLHKSDFCNFMKRFRKFISPRRIKFFHCGEYGDRLSRPHHHACIFGYDFPDKVSFSRDVFTSEILSKLWSVDGKSLGFSTVGQVTFQSAAYVARYVLKKWSRSNLKGRDLYDSMQGLSDEKLKARFYGSKLPEYVTMSRGGVSGRGLARDWLDKFRSEVFPSGFIVLPSGKKVPVPAYYDSQLSLDFPVQVAKMKIDRGIAASKYPCNQARLFDREIVMEAKLNQSSRRFENG